MQSKKVTSPLTTIGTPSKIGQIRPLTSKLLKREAGAITKAQAFNEGTNIRTALRLEGTAVRLYLLAQLERCLMLVDAGTTMQSQEERLLAIDVLIEEFPAYTVEEYYLLFNEIARGKYKLFNRLKLAELMECARHYEGVRAETILEQRHRPEYDPHPRSSTGMPIRKYLALTPEDLAEIERVTSMQDKNK